jgi:hypothetical protein
MRERIIQQNAVTYCRKLQADLAKPDHCRIALDAYTAQYETAAPIEAG